MIAFGLGLKSCDLSDKAIEKTPPLTKTKKKFPRESYIGLTNDMDFLGKINRSDYDIKQCECHAGLFKIDRLNRPVTMDSSSRTRAKQEIDPLNGSWPFQSNAFVNLSKIVTLDIDACQDFDHTTLNELATDDKLRVAIIDSGSSLADVKVNQVDPTASCHIFNYVNPEAPEDIKDESGHGTHILSIINNPNLTNKNVEFLVYKIFDGANEGDLFNGLCAFYSAIKNGANVINISWGYQANDLADNEVVLQAMAYAKSRSVIVVTAAGNNGSNNDVAAHWPSNAYNDQGLGNVVSVGALEYDNEFAEGFSNFGAQNVAVATNGLQCAYNHQNKAVLKYGTSMATAIVTQQIINNYKRCKKGLVQNCLNFEVENDNFVHLGYLKNRMFRGGNDQ